MNEQEFAELAAGHALNALSPDDEQIFQRELAVHPEWTALVESDAATVATLADGVADVPPPLAIRAALLARISAPPVPDGMPDLDAPLIAAADAPPTTDAVQTIERKSWTRGLFALAASLVLLVALGFGAVSLSEMLNTPADVVALEQIEAAPDAQTATAALVDGGEATVHWSESVGKVVLVSDGLPSIADDEAFELWFIRGDEAPIAAGTFTAEDAEATALLDGTMQPGDTIAVTIEDAGGSPSGVPTTDPIVAIPTA